MNKNNRLSDRQLAILNFIRDNPGAHIAHAHRSLEGMGVVYGRGHHRFFYNAVERLERRGLIEKKDDGAKRRLYIK